MWRRQALDLHEVNDTWITMDMYLKRNHKQFTSLESIWMPRKQWRKKARINQNNKLSNNMICFPPAKITFVWICFGVKVFMTFLHLKESFILLCLKWRIQKETMFDIFHWILDRILNDAHLNAEDVLHGMYEIEILS